jgi:hypothetical protein
MPSYVMSQDRIVIYPNKGKIAALAGLLLVVILFLSFPVAGRVSFAFGLCIALLVPCLLFTLRKLFSAEPLLVIDEKGIRAAGVGLVRWDEVEDVVEFEYVRQPMFGVFLKDVEAVLTRLTRWQAYLVRLNLELGVPPISISGGMLPYPPRNLIHHIRVRFWPQGVDDTRSDTAPSL